MKQLSVLFFTLLFTQNSFAQKLNPTDFTQDLEYLKDSLPSNHKNLFAKISREDFVKQINKIETQANDLDYDRFSTELLKLIVAIGDEHTRVWPNYDRFLPIKLSSFKEGYFVTQIDTSLSKLLLTQLVAINNKPITEVVNQFEAVVLSENTSFFDVNLMQVINKPAILKGLGIITNINEVPLTFKTTDGKEETINLKSIGPKNNLKPVKPTQYSTLLSYKQNKNYWFEYNAENETLYFKYAKCQEDTSYPFVKFNSDLFKEIGEKNPKKLIIDLRDNSGGNSAILNPFFEELASSYINKKGKLFVLIGKTTFSSALMNAVRFKRYTKAQLVGQPTSGNINHYGEVRGFDLPKTKISISYSTKYWENWKGKKGPLLPDQNIAYSIESFRNSKDEALTYVYQQK
ncbi:S41 family peptidase [Pedobacter ureilyticus]|uniref:S41 family peptidase n=1 Tax=Pedobacter ureilyticus TaxID=1393051 RepID=A0ABW9J961_9SPHI|nr:S41 family peptidase [Pedobacter helvus]